MPSSPQLNLGLILGSPTVTWVQVLLLAQAVRDLMQTGKDPTSASLLMQALRRAAIKVTLLDQYPTYPHTVWCAGSDSSVTIKPGSNNRQFSQSKLLNFAGNDFKLSPGNPSWRVVGQVDGEGQYRRGKLPMVWPGGGKPPPTLDCPGDAKDVWDQPPTCFGPPSADGHGDGHKF